MRTVRGVSLSLIQLYKGGRTTTLYCHLCCESSTPTENPNFINGYHGPETPPVQREVLYFGWLLHDKGMIPFFFF